MGGCGKVSHRIVAETVSGSAQPGREELGEVNGVAGKKRELGETNHRKHPVSIACRVEADKYKNGGHHRKNQKDQNARRRLTKTETQHKAVIPRNYLNVRSDGFFFFFNGKWLCFGTHFNG